MVRGHRWRKSEDKALTDVAMFDHIRETVCSLSPHHTVLLEPDAASNVTYNVLMENRCCHERVMVSGDRC